MLSLLGACGTLTKTFQSLGVIPDAPAPPPVSDACVWLHTFYPDADYEKRWTDRELKNQYEINIQAAKCPATLAPPSAPTAKPIRQISDAGEAEFSKK